MSDGLNETDRCLAESTAAIARADWTRFEAAVTALRDAAEAPRAELEEALLQATLFFGFPRVVTAFERAAKAWPTAPPTNDARVDEPERATAGRELFDAIYAKNAAAVHAMLNSFHPEFHDFVLESAYGRVLARDGLPPMRRELLAIAALAALDQEPQLIAHARGALRFGATTRQVRDAIAIECEPSTVDRLVARITRN